MNISQNQLATLGYENGARVEGTYSAHMNLGEHLPVAEIVHRLGSVVRMAGIAGEHWPVSGFIAAKPSEKADNILFACDPNWKGDPTPAESRLFVPKLVEIYEQEYGAISFAEEDVREDFRALPGLVKGGYSPDNYVFSKEEALSKMPRADSGIVVTEGTVWSARYRGPDNDFLDYHEAGMDIRGHADAIKDVLYMANEMDEDRIDFEITGVETQVIQRPREV